MRTVVLLSLIVTSFFSINADANHFGLGFFSSSKRGIISNGSGRSWSDSVYAKSCNEYKNPAASTKYAYKGTIGDGVYTILPTGQSTPFNVLCDMTTDGGGWTNVNTNFGSTASALYTNNGAMGLTVGAPSTSAVSGGYFDMASSGTCSSPAVKTLALARSVINSVGATSVKIEGSAWTVSGDVRCGGILYGTSSSPSVQLNTIPTKEISACDNDYTDSGYGVGYGFGAIRVENLAKLEISIPSATTDVLVFGQANLCGGVAGAIDRSRVQSIMIR